MRKFILSISMAVTALISSSSYASDYCEKLFEAKQPGTTVNVNLLQLQEMSNCPFNHTSPSGEVFIGATSPIAPTLLDYLKDQIAQGKGDELCEMQLMERRLEMWADREGRKEVIKIKKGKKKKETTIQHMIKTGLKSCVWRISRPTDPGLGSVNILLNLARNRALPAEFISGQGSTNLAGIIGQFFREAINPPAALNGRPRGMLPPVQILPALPNVVPNQPAHQLTQDERARVPANFPAQIYVEIYPDITAHAPSFNMDPLTFAPFQYGRWGHAEGRMAIAHVSYKTAPADFDSAQYLKNYPHLIKQAESYKISDLDLYAKLQYVNWGVHEGWVYK